MLRSTWILLTAIVLTIPTTNAEEGASIVSFYGYDDCIELRNEETTVTLCGAAGGRVLQYSRGGKNVLYLPAGDEGWKYTPGTKRGPMNAGRCDIGPEKVVKRGPLLWMGAWDGEITADRQATLTSQVDPVSGVQLVRTFALDADSSRLVFTQTIKNVSEGPVSLCHWSRTFAVGGGIAIVPREGPVRFPNGYVMYPDGRNITIVPEDSNITVTESDVVIKAAPKFPKLGFDSYAGWLAYLTPTDQLFVKRFRTYPERSYNEAAGLTISIWYPAADKVELEPIGPAENLGPGEQASFSEEWWLIEHPFPPGDVDTVAVHKIVDQSTTPAK